MSYKDNIYMFIDFILSLSFFPSGIKLARFFSIQGRTAVSERFFLYSIAKDISMDGDILEIGSFFGGSALALAFGNAASKKKGKLWLIEPDFKPTKEAFLQMFREHGLGSDIVLINKKSEEASKELNVKFRFIFIDGNHEYGRVKQDIVFCENILAKGGIIALHNIEMRGVQQAVNELVINSGKFKVLGRFVNTFYASKDNSKDTKLLIRLNRLSAIRAKCILIAKRLHLYSNNSLL